MGLAVQLSVSVLLITAVIVVHGTGVVITNKLFRYEDRELRRLRLAKREFRLMVPMALCLVGLHALEIAIYAAFYLAAGDAPNFHDALYQSALAYTTMGVVEGGIAKWPLVAAFEGLVGFLLIGWSAAVFVTDMERVLRTRRKPPTEGEG
jgi:hypothetical protein